MGHKAIRIADYIVTNHSGNCFRSFDVKSSSLLPTKFATSDGTRVAQFKYPHSIHYIAISCWQDDLWENYKIKFASFPNLRGVCLVRPSSTGFTCLLSMLDDLSAEEKAIWEDRILYFKSREIDVTTWEQFERQYKIEVKKQLS